MPTPTERLELFMLRYQVVRKAQKAYFSNGKMNADLKKSIAAEVMCDDLFKQLLKEGYNPDNAISNVQQSKLL